MAKKLQLRRGTTSQHSSFTGAVGEVTVDTDKDALVVHDGSTAGGFPVIGEKGGTLTDALTGVSFNATMDANTVDGFYIKNSNNATIASITSNQGVNSTTTSFSGDDFVSLTSDNNTVAINSNGHESAVFSGGSNVELAYDGHRAFKTTSTGISIHPLWSDGPGGRITIYEGGASAANYISIRSPNSLTANTDYVLPSADGSADEFLTTDGSGALSWSSASSGATGGGNDKIFVENDQTVTSSYTLGTNKHAHSVGPISINNNVVVTIPANATWLVS